MMLLCILVPILAGLLLLLMPEWKNRKSLCGYTGFFLIGTGILVVATLAVTPLETATTLFHLTEKLPVMLKIDSMGRFFAAVTTIVWVLAGIYSFSYMAHEQKEKRYYGFYLMVYGILLGLDFAGNLVTFYAFYELMTLLSMPMVLHNGSREAIMAGLKYLLFSFAGAYMALFGLYFINQYSTTLTFTAGGVLNLELLAGKEGLLLVVAFSMLLGFGVKAGMFPMHAWLPTAHPVAPAPASGALSGIIVKAGVLGVIRTVYYLFGTEFLRGTWVQNTWLVLILITVLMGSMMAYREKVFKKRLAYSTVSQVSYILLGIAMMTQDGLQGALLHTAAHAVMKCGLFLVAGAIIFRTGKTRVDEMKGIGKQMPLVMTCYVILSLSLIGIPPLAGFVSKWYLGIGSVTSGVPVFDILGPAILLVSALLTAGYLLPVAIDGFLPGADWQPEKKEDAPLLMRVVILILTLLVVLGGICPQLINMLIGEVSL